MSFDVFLQHFEGGEPAVADRAAVAAILRELEATGPYDSGHYHVLVSDLWQRVTGRTVLVAEVEILGGREAVPSPGHEPYHLAVSAAGLDGEEAAWVAESGIEDVSTDAGLRRTLELGAIRRVGAGDAAAAGPAGGSLAPPGVPRLK